MHEFLTPLDDWYEKCLNCEKRKSLVCVKCRYCYECHPISEYLESRPDRSYFAMARLVDLEAQ